MGVNRYSVVIGVENRSIIYWNVMTWMVFLLLLRCIFRFLSPITRLLDRLPAFIPLRLYVFSLCLYFHRVNTLFQICNFKSSSARQFFVHIHHGCILTFLLFLRLSFQLRPPLLDLPRCVPLDLPRCLFFG